MKVLRIIILCMGSVSNAFVGQTPLSGSRVSSTHVYASEDEDEVSIVERCYDAWNQRKMSDAAACFADRFEYDDGQYLGIINKKSDLERLFERNANALPTRSMLVLDHIAKCPTTGNIGTQWHVEREDDTIVPYTKGVSFYTTDKKSGLITSGCKVSEMLVKPNKYATTTIIVEPTKQLTDRLEGLFPKAKEESYASNVETKSIIEKYFKAWNSRDMEAALNCFVDDCIYATEDPVFVDSFRGKDALREHLTKNADTLPPFCNIILDDLAIGNEKIGVKWHLEANGMGPIPNLRGCSMYVIDKESGLLRSGFDVTESPIKLPAFAQDVLAVPLGKLLF